VSHSKTLSIQTELRKLDELRHARLEAKLDRLIAEVRSEVRAGFRELRTQLRAGFGRLDSVFDTSHFDSMLDGLERRLTIRFFVYFMSQGVLTAAMTLWMVGILR
jgi:hypothetical protein